MADDSLRHPALCLLGEAEVGLGKLPLARQHLIEAMHVMLKSQTRFFINARLVLRAWVDLLCKESVHYQLTHQVVAAGQKQLEALMVASCMVHQPQITRFYQIYAAQIATELKQKVPAALAAAAEACGQQKTVTQLITEIIQQADKAAGKTNLTPLHQHSA